MPVYKKKPITPGQRFRIANDFSVVTKKKPEKSLLYSVRKKGGRNNQGRCTMPHRGGGHKRRGRILDFKRDNFGVEGIVKSIEYDPMRTAYIMLVFYSNGKKAYSLAPQGIRPGDKIISDETVEPELGNAMPMKNMPVGTIVHNIELKPGEGGICVRSAGASAQIVARQTKYVVVKMPSTETRLINHNCMATVGVVSNGEHSSEILGKAGRKRWLGRRPRVRAVAMNPVDHPMGGGEGKASGGLPRSRKGLFAKGQKTRSPRKYSRKLILVKRK